MIRSSLIFLSFIHSFVILLFGRIMFFVFFCMTCLPIWYLKFVILECFVLFYLFHDAYKQWMMTTQYGTTTTTTTYHQLRWTNWKKWKKNVPEIKSKQNNLRNKKWNEMNLQDDEKNDWVCLSWYVIDWLIDCDHDEMIVIVM